MNIENVRIINHDSIIENADIIIEGNKIKKINEKPGKGLKTIIPGFVEMHIHGFFNYDCMQGKEAIEKISKRLKESGVTTFFPTLMTADWEQIKKSMAAAGIAESFGAKIGGIHLEGPFISHEKKGAHDPKYIIKATKEKIKELKDISKGRLNRITYAPEVNGNELIDYMTKELDMVVLIGHSNANVNQAYEAVRHGATACTHLWNGMSGVEHRNPGVAEAVLQDDKVIAELICDLVHVHPDTIKFTIKNKTPYGVSVVSDSIAPAGLPDGEYESGGLPVEKKGDVIRVISSQAIAGGAGSIDVGFKTLKKLGYGLKDIVKMTSYNAAKNQHLENIAEIKPGYFADLIVLDEKLEIEKVFVNGQ